MQSRPQRWLSCAGRAAGDAWVRTRWRLASFIPLLPKWKPCLILTSVLASCYWTFLNTCRPPPSEPHRPDRHATVPYGNQINSSVKLSDRRPYFPQISGVVRGSAGGSRPRSGGSRPSRSRVPGTEETGALLASHRLLARRLHQARSVAVVAVVVSEAITVELKRAINKIFEDEMIQDGASRV